MPRSIRGELSPGRRVLLHVEGTVLMLRIHKLSPIRGSTDGESDVGSILPLLCHVAPSLSLVTSINIRSYTREDPLPLVLTNSV